MLATKELAYWQALANAKRLSANKIKTLLDNFGSAQSVCEASPASLKTFGLNHETIQALKQAPDLQAIEPILAWLEHPQHSLLTLNDAQYPSLLKSIDNPPPILYVKGCIDILSEPQLALVGSRNPSENGKHNAFEFAKYLSASGLIITSGLALGIDAACHKGALSADGATIAVIATGIDQVYPSSHQALAEEIVTKNGAIVSEFPFGTKPRPPLFPQRNRIISGLSLGTLVIEAAIRSGSLITARHAIEQAREVFAIPGSIHNPLARGCHQLIKQGAKLVENAHDILEEIAPSLQFTLEQIEQANSEQANHRDEPLDPDYLLILEKMGYEAVTVDELISRSMLPADAVASMLMIMELRGIIAQNSDGKYCKLTNIA